MWDSTIGSQCYRWKLVEQYHNAVVRDHSSNLTVSYLDDQTRPCWMRWKFVYGFSLKRKFFVQWKEKVFNFFFAVFSVGKVDWGWKKVLMWFAMLLFMLTVVQRSRLECFYILSHWVSHLVWAKAMNPKVNDDVRCFVILNSFLSPSLNCQSAIHPNDGTIERVPIHQYMMRNVNLSN